MTQPIETVRTDPPPGVGAEKPRLVLWRISPIVTPTTKPFRQILAADGILQWCGVGEWHVRFAVDQGSSWAEDAGTSIMSYDRWLLTWGGQPLTSGYATKVTIRNARDDGGQEIELWGVTEEQVLADRIVIPDPTGNIDTAGSGFPDSHHRVSGVASTVMREYVRVHATSASAARSRSVEKLSVGPDPVIGTSIQMAERFTNLLDCVQRVAIAGGIGFAVQRDNPSAYPEFRVTTPTDRSASIIFDDDAGNASELEWTRVAPTATSILAAGSGEMQARILEYQKADVYGDSDHLEWGRTIEAFRDARSESDRAQLRRDNATALAESGMQEWVKVTASPTLSAGYGRTWMVGDIVRARVRTLHGFPLKEVVDRVQSVVWSGSAAGITFEPSIGTDGTSMIRGRDKRNTAARLRSVEAQ